MTLIFLKFLHYLSIVFAGGMIVGSGLIQTTYIKANKIPDLIIVKILKILGYMGLVSLITLWVTGVFLANFIYGGFAINTAFTVKIIAAGLLLGLSIIINFHVYNSGRKQIAPNKKIMKIGTMASRGLIIAILVGAAIAFH